MARSSAGLPFTTIRLKLLREPIVEGLLAEAGPRELTLGVMSRLP